MDSNPLKVYVGVKADFRKDGIMLPREIHWEDGRRFEIDKVTDIRQAAALRAEMAAAIAAGELDTARWESYLKLKEEAVDKAEMLRRKNEWHKGIAKFTRQRNKEIW